MKFKAFINLGSENLFQLFMNREEKYIARLMLKNKLHECDKQSFEDLFVKVMMCANPDFKSVKPQGRIGDRKNDGFDKINGLYYQVYAPEDIRAREGSAIDKLQEDFTGLVDYWQKKGFSINKFHYVVNDKYKGVYPSLHVAAENLSKAHGIEIEVIQCKNVEDKVLELTEEKILDIVGFIPDPLDIQNVDFDTMSEVVGHLMNLPMPLTPVVIPANPNFEEKIRFNGLSTEVVQYLNAGRNQVFAVSEYFELNSRFVKDDLKEVFRAIYLRGSIEINESETKNDQLFFYIRNKACPKNTLAVHSTVYILMAYYFEYCDIFETPAGNNSYDTTY